LAPGPPPYLILALLRKPPVSWRPAWRRHWNKPSAIVKPAAQTPSGPFRASEAHFGPLRPLAGPLGATRYRTAPWMAAARFGPTCRTHANSSRALRQRAARHAQSAGPGRLYHSL